MPGIGKLLSMFGMTWVCESTPPPVSSNYTYIRLLKFSLSLSTLNFVCLFLSSIFLLTMINFSFSFLNTWNIFIIVLLILSFQSVICVLFGGLFPLLIFFFIMGCIFLLLHILGSFWLHAKTCEFYHVWCFFLSLSFFFSSSYFYFLNICFAFVLDCG